MSNLTIEKGFVLNRANVLVCAIRGNIPTHKYFRLNAQSITFTPANVTTANIISRRKDTYGNALATYETDVEPGSLEINFDFGAPRAFAMALGASVDDFTQSAGDITDGKVVNIQEQEWAVLQYGAIDVDTFLLEKDGVALTAGIDYLLDPHSGTLQALNDQLASGDITATYEYGAIKGTEYHVGAETLFPVRLIADAVNAVGREETTITAWHLNLKPSDSISLMGSEPIAPTIKGELQLVPGKASPLTVRVSHL